MKTPSNRHGNRKNVRKGIGNIAGVHSVYQGADFSRSDDYIVPLWIDLAADRMEKLWLMTLKQMYWKNKLDFLLELRTTTQKFV